MCVKEFEKIITSNRLSKEQVLAAVEEVFAKKNAVRQRAYARRYLFVDKDLKCSCFDAANVLSFLKEVHDVATRQNTLDSSFADNYANKIGRLLGTKYNQEKCETLVPRYIEQYYK